MTMKSIRSHYHFTSNETCAAAKHKTRLFLVRAPYLNDGSNRHADVAQSDKQGRKPGQSKKKNDSAHVRNTKEFGRVYIYTYIERRDVNLATETIGKKSLFSH